jgi:hypothetical protein
MSLSVHARCRGSDDWEKPSPPHSDLAGFESWRRDVWGSAPVKRLGLRILPSLAGGDTFASGADLEALAHDVDLLQRSLRDIVDELLATGVHIVWRGEVRAGMDMKNVSVDGKGRPQNDPYETVRFRLANIAEAVRRARELPDGEVVIWSSRTVTETRPRCSLH